MIGLNLRRLPASSLVALALLLTAAGVSQGALLTPESREVRAAVAKAVRFMGSKSNGYGVGGDALIGMAILKADGSPNHPAVVRALKNIQTTLGRESDPTKLEFEKTYTPAVMALFLLELDRNRYRAEIEKLLRYLLSVQKPNGGWGYQTGSYAKSGDTSMMQYGALSMWEANEAGFRIPTSSIEKALVWLLRVQDPSGGFGYQGVETKDFKKPVNQHPVTPSLTAAGMGSVYICAHLLGLVDQVKEEDDGLPPALKAVEENAPTKHQTSISRGLVRTVQDRGNAWFRKNYVVDPPSWTHYYLYGLERYWSFRELVEGTSSGHPNWYHDGARYLLDTQLEEGNWVGQGGTTVPTAFATLFLVRSAKQSIQRTRDFGGGTMVGGRGLPKETDSVRVRQGQVVSSISLGSVEAMLAAAEGSQDESYFDAIEALADLPAEEAKALISQQADKLRKMAGGTSFQQRLTAVRALAKARNFDDVPTLIYALTDPEPDVVLAATDGLRRISRKFDGFGLSPGYNPAQLEVVINKWKSWYRAIRPDAEFEN